VPGGADAPHQERGHLLQIEPGVIQPRQREGDDQLVPRHHERFRELDISNGSDISSRDRPTKGHVVFIS
jgi:hypothetical protein